MIGNKLEPFKFWCQKVLPNVYDDSLSYYEYLCKLNEYLNEVIGQINTLTDNMSDYEEDLTATWLETKEYIDNYFNNLDVQQEINNKLDQMAQSGALSTLLAPIVGTQIGGVVAEQIGGTVANQIGDTVASQIGPVVASQIDEPTATATNAWLTAHVEPVGSAVIVDNTLSISGAAADAKTTGDAFDYIKDTTESAFDFAYFKIDGLISGANTWYPSTNANFYVIPVKSGDEIIIKGNATNPTVYTLLKSVSNPIISGATPDYATGYNARITIPLNTEISLIAPSDAHYIYVTNYNNAGSGDKSYLPQKLTVSGVDMLKSLPYQIGTLYKATNSINDNVNTLNNDIENILHKSEPKYAFTDNVLFENPLTLTEGKYLDPTDGGERNNESYGYSDYLSVSPGDCFYCTDTAGLYCAYDTEQTFVSGGSLTNNAVFVVPDGIYYLRISIPIAIKDIIKFTVLKVIYITSYAKRSTKTYYVDKNGNGDYIHIQEAVDQIENGDTGIIYVASGTYKESVKCWGKTIHLIGTSKTDCILTNDTQDYHNPPIEMGAGSISNMTIKATINDTSIQATAYAIHIEDDNLANKSLFIKDCDIISYSNYAIGMGMRGGCVVTFQNCRLIGQNVFGGLYFHDALNPTYAGEQNIIVEECVIGSFNSGFLMRIESESVTGTTVNMEFRNNMIRNPNAPTYEGMYFYDTGTEQSETHPTNFSLLSNFNLSPLSQGNNISWFNY